MAKVQNQSRKIKAITKLYKIWMMEYLGFARIKVLILREMKEDGVIFLSPKDIDPCFTLIDISHVADSFFLLLEQGVLYTDPAWFALLAESFMDFSSLTALDNASTFDTECLPEKKVCYNLVQSTSPLNAGI